jgi:hypothetical protein
MGEKEKKRKGGKPINLDDGSSEIGLQSMIFVPTESLEWPFGGTLAAVSGTSSSFISNVMRNRPFANEMPLTSAHQLGGNTIENSGDNGMLSLEFSRAWPNLSGSSNQTQSNTSPSIPEENNTSPMASAMGLLKPLIELKKKEEKLHSFEFNEKDEDEAQGGEEVETSEGVVGYAQLIGFVHDSTSNKNNAKGKCFKSTIVKSSTTIGNAAHESQMQGRASMSSWHRALNTVCGAALATSSLFTPGSVVGDMDVHLGDNIEAGVNARIFWVANDNNASAMSDSDTAPATTGCFYLQAHAQGVAVEGKVVPIGSRVALSSGSVLSFGTTSGDKSYHPKVIAQFLLPETATNTTSVTQPMRASEKLLLGALRIASLDADLRKYLPNFILQEPAPLPAPLPPAPAPLPPSRPEEVALVPAVPRPSTISLQSV